MSESDISGEERFVVLGSNSFSGASFVQFVLRHNPNASVVGISRSREPREEFLPYRAGPLSRFRFVRLDLNHDTREIANTIKRIDPHYIVNFAALGMSETSWIRPWDWFRTNCESLVRLVDHIVEPPSLRRFVQISTPEVYGRCEGLIGESKAFAPDTPHAASRAAGELAMLPYWKERGLPVVFTRPVEVYGAHQQLYKLIPRSVLSLLGGRRVLLERDGSDRRSFIHVRDLASAILAVARFGANGEAYHVAPSGEAVEVAAVIRKIGEFLGRSEGDCIEFKGVRKCFGGSIRLNSEKLRALGWEPEVGFDWGLGEVIAWVEKNRSLFSELPTVYIHKP